MGETKEVRVFQLNEEKEEFEELELIGEVQLSELLDSEEVLAFIDMERKIVWTWIGNITTTRKKFIAGVKSIKLRNQYAFGYKIVVEIEGEESRLFKIFLGLEEPSEETEEEVKPLYDETQEEEMTKESILLRLAKIPIAEGFERKMVVVHDQIFNYKEDVDIHLDDDVKSKKLLTLQEDIDDGSYLLDEYVPKILFSFNKIVLIEILKRKE